MNMISAKDGTRIHYKDRGAGQPIVLSHGWPLHSDSREPHGLTDTHKDRLNADLLAFLQS